MARFLIRRVLQGMFVLLLMTFTVYAIFFLGPGPQYVARALAGKAAPPAQVRAGRAPALPGPAVECPYGHYIGRPAARQPGH